MARRKSVKLTEKQLNEKIVSEVAFGLEEKLVSPHEILTHPFLTDNDKVTLLLSPSVMPDWGFHQLTLAVVSFLRERFAERNHEYDLFMSGLLKDTLNQLERYANEETTAKELDVFLKRNKLGRKQSSEITPMVAAIISISFLQYVATASASQDLTVYLETDMDVEKYLSFVDDDVNTTILAMLEGCYDRLLH